MSRKKQNKPFEVTNKSGGMYNDQMMSNPDINPNWRDQNPNWQEGKIVDADKNPAYDQKLVDQEKAEMEAGVEQRLDQEVHKMSMHELPGYISKQLDTSGLLKPEEKVLKPQHFSLGEIAQVVTNMAKQNLDKPIEVGLKFTPDYPREEWGLPIYQTAGAAAFDVRALIPEADAPVVLTRDNPKMIRTGLHFELPEGYVLYVFSRSGLGFKNGVRLGNCVGVLDSDYRGELLVTLHCDRTSPIEIQHGMRIAQCVVMPVPKVNLVVKEELSDTERGEGGGGSTGVF